MYVMCVYKKKKQKNSIYIYIFACILRAPRFEISFSSATTVSLHPLQTTRVPEPYRAYD